MKLNLSKLFIIICFSTIIISNFSNCKSTNSNNEKQDTVLTKEVHAKGSIPFDFPTVNTTAKEGEYVLAPSLDFLTTAWISKGENSMFIFYSRQMIKVGELESEILEIGNNVIIPNSLIIPIRANQQVKKGDVLLTWWQSGSGMSRAIVVDAKIPTEPVVRYLDLEWEYYGTLEEKLIPNSFVKITEEWQPGTVIAYKDSYYMNRVQVVRIEGEKVLTIGWAGRIEVLKKSDCHAIPINLEIKKGDKVQVPYIGSFTDGIVKKYDANIGRAWVEIEFGGNIIEIVVARGDIAKDLILI